MKPLYERLKYRVPLRLSGFDILYDSSGEYKPESHEQLMLNDKSFQENYDLFKKHVISSMGEEFLPIYRMADGEFIFIQCMERTGFSIIFKLERIKSNFISLFRNPKIYGRTIPKRRIEKLKSLFDPYYHRTAHNESYTKREFNLIKENYIDYLKTISIRGLLAIHFVDFTETRHPYWKHYATTSDWFQKCNIILDETNYTSFYYVYALLTGPDRTSILKNKKVMIITSLDKQKKINIMSYLNKEQVASVDFINISPSKSMFEKIHFSNLKPNYDLVLIGAGIGSVNILHQCEKLNTVCIDAGIVLERYGNRNLSKSRLFIL